MTDIDSDDDFFKCYVCHEELDVSEICIYKKSKVCKKCEENEIAQPVRMIYKRRENCCGHGNCVQIKSCGKVQGHIHLSSCDPELVDYPYPVLLILPRGKNRGRRSSVCILEPFEETNLLRRLRLAKTERLNLVKKTETERLKVKKEVLRLAKRLAKTEQTERLNLVKKTETERLNLVKKTEIERLNLLIQEEITKQSKLLRIHEMEIFNARKQNKSVLNAYGVDEMAISAARKSRVGPNGNF